MADNKIQETSTRFGFLKEKFSIPENFDHLYQDEIIEMFSGDISGNHSQSVDKEKPCST